MLFVQKVALVVIFSSIKPARCRQHRAHLSLFLGVRKQVPPVQYRSIAGENAKRVILS
jgi:hypothetical protein